MGSNALYEQQPLAQDAPEIRLLELSPSADKDGAITTTLHLARLDENPMYFALSYVWGDPSITQPISVNGRAFSVTENLASALSHLRRVDEPLMLWIDAICINQSDASEKSRQIRLMETIYHRATKVIAWLGPAADESECAMQLLKHIADAGLERDRDMKLEQPETGGIQTIEGTLQDIKWRITKFDERDESSMKWIKRISELCSPDDEDSPYCNRAWDATEKLLLRPYFDRLWILQEMVLAANLVFVCGFDSVTWVILEQVLHCLDLDTVDKIKPFITEQVWKTLLWVPSAHLDHVRWLRKSRSLGQTWSIFWLIPAVIMLQASDPRDNIYGLMGITSNHDITVDYSKPVDLLYQEFAAKWMSTKYQEEGTLLPIHFAGIGNPRGNVPRGTKLSSWAPYLAKFCEHSRQRSMRLWRSNCNAAPRSRVKMRVSPENVILWLQGISVGSVDDFLWPCNHPIDANGLVRFCSTLVSTLPSTGYPNGMPIMQVALNILLGLERRHPGSLRFKSAYMAFQDYLSESINAVQAETLGTTDSILVDEVIQAFELSTERVTALTEEQRSDKLKEAEMFKDFVNANLHGQRIFQTADGYLGVGPSLMQKDDVVCIFSGLKTPFILRKEGTHYLLVGYCFVLGMMDGEAVAGIDNWEASLQDFEIH